jgi:hypothetical protein
MAADEFAKLEEEFRLLLMQLKDTADSTERKLLLADIKMLVGLAERLVRQHDESVRRLLKKAH